MGTEAVQPGQDANGSAETPSASQDPEGSINVLRPPTRSLADCHPLAQKVQSKAHRVDSRNAQPNISSDPARGSDLDSKPTSDLLRQLKKDKVEEEEDTLSYSNS